MTALPFQRHADRAAAVLAGVLQQVGQDALEAQLVEPHQRGAASVVDLDRHVAEAVALGDARDELADVDLLAVQLGRAGVDAGQLEQVHHHVVEAAHLADHHVQRLLRALGEVVAAAVEHLDRGGERGDRRAQLVAHVAGEAGLALDAGLHRVGHVVERAGQAVQVRVVLRRHARVEAAGGDLARRGGRHGTTVAAVGGSPTSRAKPASSMVTSDPMSSAVAMARRLRWVLCIGNASRYCALHRRHVHPDGHVGLAAVLEPLLAAAARGMTTVAQLRRERVQRVAGVQRELHAVQHEHREAAALGAQVGTSNCLVDGATGRGRSWRW